MQSYALPSVKSYLEHYGGLARPCYRGFALSLFESIFIGIYYYLSIYFIDVLHFSVALSGLIISCYGVGAILGGILGGKLSDRLSPGVVSAGAMLMQSLAFFIFMKINSVAWLVCNVFMLGVASYGFITANHLYVLSFCRGENHQRLKALNILATTSNLGLGISAMMMGVVLQFGFQKTFFMAACGLLMLAIISFDNIKSEPILAAPEENQARVLRTRKKVVLLTLFCVFAIGLIVSQLGSTYATYVKASYPAFGIKAVTLLFALNSFLVVLLGVPLGECIKQYNKIKMVGVGGFLIGSGMFMLVFSYSFIMAAIACVVYTLGEIVFFSVAQLVCYQNGLQNKKGQAMGVFRMVYASTRVVGPAAGGLVFARFGGTMVWLICGIIGSLCFAFCHHYKRYG